jgi:hypothetical protein
METKRPSEPLENEIEELERGNVERLSNLQRLVRELLTKNQCLRMELMAERAKSGHDKGSALFSEYTEDLLRVR